MVNLLFIEDDEALTKPGVVRSLYDPTAGTGGKSAQIIVPSLEAYEAKLNQPAMASGT